MYTFPVADAERVRAHGSIETLKHALRFENIIAKAISGRVLKITGWPLEVWEDRRLLIEEALHTYYNPAFCDAVSVSETTRYHDMVDQNVEDRQAPLSRKGHDDIRQVMNEILRKIYPDLGKKQRDEIRRGCETRLFFFLKNTLNDLKHRR